METAPDFTEYVKLSFEAPKEDGATAGNGVAPAALRGAFNFRALQTMPLYSL